MTNLPLVSVIIPVYNVEKYLRQCLDSVVNQTYKNLEIVCVNDGSPDRSIDILEEYAHRDNRLHVISIENQGLSGARNVGTAACNGEYLMYLDSDDWVDLDTVEKAITAMTDNSVDLVLWNYSKEYTSSSQPVMVFNCDELFTAEKYIRLHQRLVGLTGDQLKHPEQCDSISTAWGKLYKTSIIRSNNIQFVDTKLIGTEDLLFNAEVFNYCTSAFALPDCFNHYRKSNANSLTKQYRPQFFQQWTELQRRLKILCEDRDYLQQSFSNRVALSTIGIGLRIASSSSSIPAKIKALKDVINTPRYQDAYANLEMRYLPAHWKAFFLCAKYKMSRSLLCLLWIMRKIINRNSKQSV